VKAGFEVEAVHLLASGDYWIVRLRGRWQPRCG